MMSQPEESMMPHQPTALVTGGTSGVGRATAAIFATAGYRVWLTGTDEERGAAAVQAISAQGGEAHFWPADLRREQDVEALFGQIEAAGHRLSAAVNSAAIDPEVAPVADWSVATFDNVIETNLRGVFLAMRHELEHMVAGGTGAIVNISSIAGLRGVGFKPAYSASKHGIIGLTRSAALGYAARNVRVNVICPACIDTPMLEESIGPSEEARAQAAASHPLGRIGRPEEIGEAALWLCSDKAAFVTGHTLAVDGGLMA